VHQDTAPQQGTATESTAGGAEREPSIVIEGLAVRYGNFYAVDSLHLRIYPGEVFGLLGPNGAGKSSTLRVLIGQRRPSFGTVSVLGRDIVREWSKIKPDFGYVPDRENSFEELTGRRNLKIFAALYRVDAERVDECLRLVELEHAADTRVRAYSLGMRRKLLLARAVLHRPKVLYLDEPTANLDVHSAGLVHGILRELANDGCTVMLTTHDMREVEEICDRVAIIRDGREVALGRPRDLQMRDGGHTVAVELASGEKRHFDLEDDGDRAALAQAIADGGVSHMTTQRADFRAAFLQMTGGEKD
jgi:ABC-type multidrug transport system ATPase subunit